MVQELLTYDDLTDRLQISTSAAKAIAKGLRLPRYGLPDGRTVVLCDLGQLRVNAELSARELTQCANRGRDRAAIRSLRGPQSASRPLRRCRRRWSSSGAEMIAWLHMQIDELQRQLAILEQDGCGQMAVVENSMRARFRRITGRFGISRQSTERARGGGAGHGTRRWWGPASA